VLLLIGIAIGIGVPHFWKFCRWLAKPDGKSGLVETVVPPVGPEPTSETSVAEELLQKAKVFYDTRKALVQQIRAEQARYKEKGDAGSMYRADQLGTAAYYIDAFSSENAIEALENLKRE
jgi:hypothetical protein